MQKETTQPSTLVKLNILFLIIEKFYKLHPYLRFALLLIFYSVAILLFSRNFLRGDEPGYIAYAQNLTSGFLTDSNDVNIWWGPGYPLILSLFLKLSLPLLIARLLNAVFLYLTLIFSYKVLYNFLDEKKSFWITLVIGIYPPLLREMFFLHSEIFSVFILSVCIFLSVKIFNDESRKKYLILLSFLLAYLAVTKVIFGYVYSFILIISVVLYFFRKNKLYFKKTIFIYLLALVFCLPYLIYTYSLTGRVFFWGNTGGINLYYATSPYSGEYGDWYGKNIFLDNPQAVENHKNMLTATDSMKVLQKDNYMREQGIKNFFSHPAKYFYNWFCSAGRIMFNYPYSYSLQKPGTYFFIIPNMFLFVILFFALITGFRKRKKIPGWIYFTLVLAFFYFFLISLLASAARYTSLFYPLMILYISYVFFKFVKIEIR